MLSLCRNGAHYATTSKTPSFQVHLFIQTSIAFMLACMFGDTIISVSTMGEASLPEMKTGTAFAKCT